MKILTFEEVLRLHFVTFGIEPVITGERNWESDALTTQILKVIDEGTPDLPKIEYNRNRL